MDYSKLVKVVDAVVDGEWVYYDKPVSRHEWGGVDVDTVKSPVREGYSIECKTPDEVIAGIESILSDMPKPHHGEHMVHVIRLYNDIYEGGYIDIEVEYRSEVGAWCEWVDDAEDWIPVSDWTVDGNTTVEFRG